MMKAVNKRKSAKISEADRDMVKYCKIWDKIRMCASANPRSLVLQKVHNKQNSDDTSLKHDQAVG